MSGEINLEEAEATYRQQVVQAYNLLSFSGLEYGDPSLVDAPLEHIFVRLTLTVEKRIQQAVPSGEVSQTERRSNQQRDQGTTVQEPMELSLALKKHLLIVGEPGAGKSTLLRWLAVTFAQGRQQNPDRLGPSADADRLPILVELGRLPDRYLKAESGEVPNWITFLPEYLTTQQMAFTSVPAQLLKRALLNGNCLLLFDGLDEVANRQVRANLAKSLADFARLFPNRVIIGSRPAGIGESESTLRFQFQRCQIAPFTLNDVQRFFRFWYALAANGHLSREQRQAEADRLYMEVQSIPAILQLATTPLLSTILVLIWRNEGVLPERRVELYERCCKVLIERRKRSHETITQYELADLDWGDYLRLLAPLAYTIHSQEQPTSATKDELIPILASTLGAERGYDQQTATKIAKQFLATLGLHSGLLQYMGDDRYRFPHLTFQEYLTARYIAAQNDPECIDLVMTHLHEAWWQEVHLLTIGHLGSGKAGAAKASALLLKILRLYRPPWKIFRTRSNTSRNMDKLGRYFPQMQLDCRIAWTLAREFELAARGYAECSQEGTTAIVRATLLAQAGSLLQHILSDAGRCGVQKNLLTAIGKLAQGNNALESILLTALIDDDWAVREAAIKSVGPMGVRSEEVVTFLHTVLYHRDREMRNAAIESLGQLGADNEHVVSVLIEALDHPDVYVQKTAILEPWAMWSREQGRGESVISDSVPWGYGDAEDSGVELGRTWSKK